MKLKKVYCYMFVLVLLINSPISVYAQATSTTPTVTIAAGTGAAVGGAYQGYTSKTAAAATALTIAILSATGAAVKLTEASVQAGKTVYQVINDKFAQWVGGTSAEELTPSQAEELQSRFKVITGGGGSEDPNDSDDDKGVNVGEDGKLWFSPASLEMLKKFTDFLEQNNDIHNMPVEVPANAIDLGFLQTVTAKKAMISWNNMGKWSVEEYSTDAAILKVTQNGNMVGICAISKQQFTIRGYDWYPSNDTTGNWQSHTADVRNGYAIWWGSVPNSNATNFIPGGAASIDINNVGNLRSLITKFEAPTGTGEIEQDGIYTDDGYDNSIIDNPNNQIFVVDPGILNGFDVDSDRQITIPDYLDLIIQQAEQKAKKDAQNDPSLAPQELPVPLLDPLTGSRSPANWIDPKPDDATIDPIESEKRDPDPEDPKDPVIDDDTPTDPEDAVELLKVDLTRIFPFCIPWDLYRLLSKFNAEPVTPSITIDWGDILGTFGIDYVTTLDLHDYDGVASILRTMETVAFCVGLAVATRSIFLRS